MFLRSNEDCNILWEVAVPSNRLFVILGIGIDSNMVLLFDCGVSMRNHFTTRDTDADCETGETCMTLDCSRRLSTLGSLSYRKLYSYYSICVRVLLS
jgi:hypothetical protein